MTYLPLPIPSLSAQLIAAAERHEADAAAYVRAANRARAVAADLRRKAVTATLARPEDTTCRG